ncbi:MAG: hypothetical protein OIF50_03220 [Flavobacteriaceae bacterium]|nr:hypothetical protein [Flavobacteriaceae bacterium]
MRRLFLYFFLLFGLFSCKSILVNKALKRMHAFDTQVRLIPLEVTDKEVLFLPMHHIGRPLFYKQVGKTLDSLQKQGFVVYYEGVHPNNNLSKEAQDTNDRKLRRMLGVSLNIPYYDTVQKVLLGRYKYKGRHLLTNQPKVSKMGVDSLQAVAADVSVQQLVDKYEKEHGAIELDSCDIATPLTQFSYPCYQGSTSKTEFRKTYVVGYRNTILKEFIAQSKSNKIVLLYGSGHLEDLKQQLANN